MLLSFRVKNFRSLREEQMLSLVRSTHHTTGTHVSPTGTDGGVSTLAAIYGPNASGTSNLLHAIRYATTLVRDSHSRQRPGGGTGRDPFRLDAVAIHEPSLFEVVLRVKGVRYQYGFEVDDAAVVREWLYAYPHGRRRTWFERDSESDDRAWHFGTSLTGPNRLISAITRTDSLFLSASAALGHPQLGPVSEFIAQQMRFALSEADEPDGLSERLRRVTHALTHDAGRRDRLIELLQGSDLGICGIDVVADPPSAPPAMLVRHTIGDAASVVLPLTAESSGTQALLALGDEVLDVLVTGGTLFVDKIDTSLHPSLVAEIVRIFSDRKLNTRPAQLVFTSHQTSLMSAEDRRHGALERDQIWFAEKDTRGRTAIFPLTDLPAGATRNPEAIYLIGRYGAVPMVDLSLLAASVGDEVP